MYRSRQRKQQAQTMAHKASQKPETHLSWVYAAHSEVSALQHIDKRSRTASKAGVTVHVRHSRAWTRRVAVLTDRGNVLELFMLWGGVVLSTASSLAVAWSEKIKIGFKLKGALLWQSNETPGWTMSTGQSCLWFSTGQRLGLHTVQFITLRTELPVLLSFLFQTIIETKTTKVFIQKKTFFWILYYVLTNFFLCMCVYSIHGEHTEVRVQLENVSSFFLPSGSQGSESDLDG